MRLRFDLLPSYRKKAGTAGTAGTVSIDADSSVPNLKTNAGTAGTGRLNDADLSPVSPKQKQNWGHNKPLPDGAVPIVPNVPTEKQIQPNNFEPLCDESLFEQYGLSLLNSEQGMTRLNELYKKALTKTEDKELAWRFAESTALLEHLGDDRRACLECRYYKRHWEQNYGTCLKAGKANLTHMRHKAIVCWYWLNRCPQNTARQRSEHV